METPHGGHCNIKIIEILAEPGTVPMKFEEHCPYLRRGYRYGVVYKLEDGQELHTHESSSKLRDANAALASLPKAPEWEMQAIFKNGVFIGTRSTVTFSIG